MHKYHQPEDRVQLTLDLLLDSIQHGQNRVFFPGCPDGSRLNAGLTLLPGEEDACRSMSSCLECSRGRDLFLEDAERALGFNLDLGAASSLLAEYAATGPNRQFPVSCSVGQALSTLMTLVKENQDMRVDSPAREGVKAAVRGTLGTWSCYAQANCASCPNGRRSLTNALLELSG